MRTSSEYTGLSSSCLSSAVFRVAHIDFSFKISLHYIIKGFLCIKEFISEGEWEIKSTLSPGIKFIEVLERPYRS